VGESVSFQITVAIRDVTLVTVPVTDRFDLGLVSFLSGTPPRT